MLIQKEDNFNPISIKGYSPGSINISGEIYTTPLVLSAQELKIFDVAENFQQLTTQHIKSLVVQETEVFIIGTGKSHQFLDNDILQSLHHQGIAVEAMATRQACHTFQVLTYEKRKIIALLFP